jgi:flagellin
MAKEMVEFVKSQILIQASIAMMAQANTMQKNILQLLK